MQIRFLCAAKLLHRVAPLVGALLMSGCNRAPQNAPAPKTAANSFVSPRDDLDRPIKLSAAAQRVVVIGPGATETIFALGADKQLVGRDSASDYPKAAQKIAITGNFSGPFVEKTVAARPDLVIVQGETWDAARVENWQKQIGAPVAALTATNVQDVMRDIQKIGAWLGRGKQAKPIMARLQATAVPGTDPAYVKDTVFLEVSRSPLWTAGRGTLLSDVAAHSGWSNIASNISGYKAYSLESLLAHQPDVYIVPMKPPNSRRALTELRSVTGLSRLRAVREGRVVAIDADLLLRPGPRLADGIKQLRDYIKKANP